MNLLKFKRKFIELYNQQRFTRFPKDTIDEILAGLEIEEVEAPTLVEAVCLAVNSKKNLDLEGQAALQSCLYEILEMEELKAFADWNATLNPKVAANMMPYTLDIPVDTNEYTLYSSRSTESTDVIETVGKFKPNKPVLRASEARQLADLNFDFTVNMPPMNLTFFTNWAPMEAETEFVFNNNEPEMHSSVYYPLGNIGISAKLYDTASMRSMTEYYISYYANNDTYLSDVADETLHEFLYNEL